MKKITASILLSGLLSMVGCASTHWEYKIVHTIGGVNERTTQDWKLDRVIVNPDGSHDYLLKRAVP